MPRQKLTEEDVFSEDRLAELRRLAGQDAEGLQERAIQRLADLNDQSQIELNDAVAEQTARMGASIIVKFGRAVAYAASTRSWRREDVVAIPRFQQRTTDKYLHMAKAQNRDEVA